MNDFSLRDLPGNFRRILLQLAREPGHPEGDSGIGYVLLAPLNQGGLLDVSTARLHRDECRIRRIGSGHEEEGYLRRRPGGSWAFHYELDDGADDDDPAYRLGEHRFVVGEYVTIEEDDGAHTYRVAAVDRIP